MEKPQFQYRVYGDSSRTIMDRAMFFYVFLIFLYYGRAMHRLSPLKITRKKKAPRVFATRPIYRTRKRASTDIKIREKLHEIFRARRTGIEFMLVFSNRLA